MDQAEPQVGGGVSITRRSFIAASARWLERMAFGSCLAWLVVKVPGPQRMPLDLVAVHSPYLCVIAIGVTAFWLARRRIRRASWAAVAALLAATPMLSRPSAPGADIPTDDPSAIHVAWLNVGQAANEPVFRWIAASDPDVVMLTEVPGAMMRSIHRRTDPLAEILPHRWTRGPSEERGAWTVILSRYPAQRPAWAEDGDKCVVVDHPAGAFAAIAFYAKSPRTYRRFVLGNAEVVRVAGLASAAHADGLDAIVAGDINNTRTGVREWLLRSGAQLTRLKPRWKPVGTLPATETGFGGLAIDGVWVTPGLRRVEWAVSGPIGSDHLGIRAVIGR